jgi:hypothetical protein
VLGKFVGDGKCLGKPDYAVKIEGLASKEGALYFRLQGAGQEQADLYPYRARSSAIF